MSKKKSHSKNLSQQAIDLINTYNSYKQRNLASINLDKKRSLYSPRVSKCFANIRYPRGGVRGIAHAAQTELREN